MSEKIRNVDPSRPALDVEQDAAGTPALAVRNKATSGRGGAIDVQHANASAPAIRAQGPGDLLDLRDSSGTRMLRVSQTGALIGSGGYESRSRQGIVAAAQALTGESAPRLSAVTSSAPTSGDTRATLCGLFAGEVITNIYTQVTVAGTTVTLARAGIWSTSGTLLASTADLSASQFASGTGPKGGALSSPYTVPSEGGYYIGWIFVASTTPTLLRTNAATTGNVGTSPGSGSPFAISATGGSDIASIAVTAANTAYWVGWS